LAPDLLPAPGAVVLRSDVERKAMFGVAETEPLPPAAYAAEVSTRLYARLAETARRVVVAGHSVVVDAVFARPDERAAIAAVAAAEVGLHGLFLTADLDIRLARVGGRSGDASDAGVSVAREQEDYALGDLEWTVIDASGAPADTLARAKSALT